MDEPTDELTWLRARLEAMMPGPWEAQRAHEGWDMAPVTDDAGMRAQDAIGIVALRNLAPAMLAVVEAVPDVECCNFPPSSEFNCYLIEREPYHDFPCLACAKELFRAAVREEQERG